MYDIEFVKLEKISKISSGGTPSRKIQKYWDGNIPWVKTALIHNNIILENDIDERITEEGLQNSSAKIVSKGSIIMAMYGQGKTRGRVAILGLNASINQACAAIEINSNVSNEYIYQQLLFRYNSIRGLSNSGGQKNLSSGIIKKIKIPLPPLPEQRVIADILSTLDTAIEKMEKLIEVKEKRFKAQLNDLLNNPENDWQNVSLGDIGEISSAGVDKKINKDEKSVRLVNYLDVYRTDHIYSDNLSHEVTAPRTKAIKCEVKKGDIFFTPTSEVNYDIANSAVAMEDIPDAVYSYHVVRLRVKEEWDLLFKAYAFKSAYFYKQAYQYCEGSGQRYVISQKSFRKIKVYVPPIEKQKQIGQILFNAQNEIKVLKGINNKHKEQKRGLMQKLLTGEWRVKA